jgi:hypothetical protein
VCPLCEAGELLGVLGVERDVQPSFALAGHERRIAG